MATNKLTVERIMGFNPCPRYPRERVERIIGDGKTLKQYLRIPLKHFDKPADKYWTLTRPGVLPDRTLHMLAIRAAEMVLPIFEEKYPDDNRPRKAIEAKKKWLDGKISDEELRDAYYAAYAAAYDARAAAAAVRSAADAARSARAVRAVRAVRAARSAYAAAAAVRAAAYAVRAAAAAAAADAIGGHVYTELFKYCKEII